MAGFDFAFLALVKHQDWSCAQKEGIYRHFLEARCRPIEGTPGGMLGDVRAAIDDYTAGRLSPDAFAGRLMALGASQLGQGIVTQMTGFCPPFDDDYEASLAIHLRSLVSEGVN